MRYEFFGLSNLEWIRDAAGESFVDIGPYEATFVQDTPTLTILDRNGNYTVTVTGVDGIPVHEMEGITPVLTFYTGSGISGTALSSPPSEGTYTVRAFFLGSTQYRTAELTSIIVPQVISSSMTDFPPGKNGVMATPDGTVSAAIFQSGKHTLPVIVTLEHYGTDPVFGSSSGAKDHPLILIASGGTQVFEVAANDLQMTGAQAGDEVIVRFGIPANDARPPLLYHNPRNPLKTLLVPQSMITVVNGAFQITFTDSTPVTIYDLFGTIFTITDLSSVVPVIGSTLSTLQDAVSLQQSSGEDVLGSLLISQNVNQGGQLVGVIAPSQTQIALLGSGTDADGTEPRFSSRQHQELLRILDTFYRGMQHLLSPHLHLLMESLMVTMPSSLIEPLGPTPAVEAAPVPWHTKNIVTI